jgi:hypothetical protein
MTGQYPSGTIRLRDLSKELGECTIPSNRIVERFLFHRVVDKGLDCGINCAGDIHSFMKRKDIPVPGGKNPKLWLNRQIWDASKNHPKHFKIVEIEGSLSGINFAWWYLNGVNNQNPKPDPQNTGDSDYPIADRADVCQSGNHRNVHLEC